MPVRSDRSHVVMYSQNDEDQFVENFEPEEVGSRLGSIVLFEDWRREKKKSILLCFQNSFWLVCEGFLLLSM